jgi:hypothetical protein
MHNQIWVSFLVGLLSTGNLSCAIHLLFGIPTGLLLSCVCSNRPQTFGKCTKSSKLKGRASFTSTTALWGWRTSTKRVNPRLPSPGPACKPHPSTFHQVNARGQWVHEIFKPQKSSTYQNSDQSGSSPSVYRHKWHPRLVTVDNYLSTDLLINLAEKWETRKKYKQRQNWPPVHQFVSESLLPVL